MTALVNPQRGQLGFEVDKANYVFAFTTNALCAVEEAFNLNDIRQLETILNDAPSMRTIRTLFRIGLTDCQPDMTDQEAGALMQAIGGLEPSLHLLMLAIEQAFPEVDGTANPPGPPTRKKGRGTGRRFN